LINYNISALSSVHSLYLSWTFVYMEHQQTAMCLPLLALQATHTSHTPCFIKKPNHFYFCNNFSKSGQILVIFSHHLIQKGSAEEA